MAGIALTKKCQLNCKYCFAKDINKIDKNEISIEDFKYALNFLKSSDNNEPLKLVGGEPLLHSKFSEILDIITQDDFFKSVEVFSNGIDIDKYINKLLHNKIILLINCNSENDIGNTLYNKLKNNVAMLSDIYKDRFYLGINLYKKDLDYSFIFDLLKAAKLGMLRFSIAVSNFDKENTSSILQSYKEFQPLLRNFFKDCIKNEVVPYYDCNSLPGCILEPEDKKLLLNLNDLSKKNHYMSTLFSQNKCNSVITILPDLTACKCFFYSLNRVNIKDFKYYKNLKDYFSNTMDIYFDVAFIKRECENCKTRINNRCGICPLYKMKRVDEIKKMLISNL